MTKNDYINLLNDIKQNTSLSCGTIDVIKMIANKVFEDELKISICEKINKDLFDGEYAIGEEMIEEAERMGFDPYEFALFISVWHLKTTKENYKLKNIDDKVFYTSADDISLFSEECNERHGRYGLDLDYYKWNTRMFKMKSFGFGKLRYIKGKYDKDLSLSIGKLKIEKGIDVYDLHIMPKCKLDIDSLISSFKDAYEFFGVSGNMVMICTSWLLYYKHRDFLPESSNIINFMNQFHMIENIEYSSMHEMWRVFGNNVNYEDPDKLPQKTTLQKAYAKWIKEKGLVGEGCGIIVFDGNNVI